MLLHPLDVLHLINQQHQRALLDEARRGNRTASGRRRKPLARIRHWLFATCLRRAPRHVDPRVAISQGMMDAVRPLRSS